MENVYISGTGKISPLTFSFQSTSIKPLDNAMFNGNASRFLDTTGSTVSDRTVKFCTRRFLPTIPLSKIAVVLYGSTEFVTGTATFSFI